MSEETIRPFHCGTQAADWTEANCRRCARGAPDDGSWPTCDIEAALVEAYVGDGRVSLPIAKRMGVIEYSRHYGWPCSEWEALADVEREEDKR